LDNPYNYIIYDYAVVELATLTNTSIIKFVYTLFVLFFLLIAFSKTATKYGVTLLSVVKPCMLDYYFDIASVQDF